MNSKIASPFTSLPAFLEHYGKINKRIEYNEVVEAIQNKTLDLSVWTKLYKSHFEPLLDENILIQFGLQDSSVEFLDHILTKPNEWPFEINSFSHSLIFSALNLFPDSTFEWFLKNIQLFMDPNTTFFQYLKTSKNFFEIGSWSTMKRLLVHAKIPFKDLIELISSLPKYFNFGPFSFHDLKPCLNFYFKSLFSSFDKKKFYKLKLDKIAIKHMLAMLGGKTGKELGRLPVYSLEEINSVYALFFSFVPDFLTKYEVDILKLDTWKEKLNKHFTLQLFALGKIKTLGSLGKKQQFSPFDYLKKISFYPIQVQSLSKAHIKFFFNFFSNSSSILQDLFDLLKSIMTTDNLELFKLWFLYWKQTQITFDDQKLVPESILRHLKINGTIAQWLFGGNSQANKIEILEYILHEKLPSFLNIFKKDRKGSNIDSLVVCDPITRAKNIALLLRFCLDYKFQFIHNSSCFVLFINCHDVTKYLCRLYYEKVASSLSKQDLSTFFDSGLYSLCETKTINKIPLFFNAGENPHTTYSLPLEWLDKKINDVPLFEWTSDLWNLSFDKDLYEQLVIRNIPDPDQDSRGESCLFLHNDPTTIDRFEFIFKTTEQNKNKLNLFNHVDVLIREMIKQKRFDLLKYLDLIEIKPNKNPIVIRNLCCGLTKAQVQRIKVLQYSLHNFVLIPPTPPTTPTKKRKRDL